MSGTTTIVLSGTVRYYYYPTTICQGSAFLCGVLYSYTDYRKWIFWGSGMAMLCLPVDVIIFYKEPLGVIGKYLGHLTTSARRRPNYDKLNSIPVKYHPFQRHLYHPPPANTFLSPLIMHIQR